MTLTRSIDCRDMESLEFWHTYQGKVRPQITDNKSPFSVTFLLQ